MELNFTKMQGCGNDYVYVYCPEGSIPSPEKVAVYVSQRRHNIGADGLILISPSKEADFRMQMYNADGSLGQMCGNGVRCVGKYVYDHKLTTQTALKIETAAGVKDLELIVGEDDKVAEVVVDMGEPIVRTKLIPMISDHFVFMDQGLDIDMNYETVINGTAVSMGNPHFVIFVDDVEHYDVETLGRKIEHHPLFPAGVNVEFVEVVDSNTVKFRVWERGSGETLSCGTGACAVCYTSISLSHAGKAGEFMNVESKGGTLQVKLGKKDNHLYLKGPAVTVCEGTVVIPESVLA